MISYITNSTKIDHIYFISNSFFDLYKHEISGNFLLILVPDSGNVDLRHFQHCNISDNYIDLQLKIKLFFIAGEFSKHSIQTILSLVFNHMHTIKQFRILDFYPMVDDRFTYDFRFLSTKLSKYIVDMIELNTIEELNLKGFYNLNFIFSAESNYEYDDIFCPSDPDEKLVDMLLFQESVTLAREVRNAIWKSLPKATKLYKLNFSGVIYVNDDWVDLLCDIIKSNNISELDISLCNYERSSNINKIIESISTTTKMIRFTIQQGYKYISFDSIDSHIEHNRNALLNNCINNLRIPDEISELVFQYI